MECQCTIDYMELPSTKRLPQSLPLNCGVLGLGPSRNGLLSASIYLTPAVAIQMNASKRAMHWDFTIILVDAVTTIEAAL